jgi:hypothetical protein
MLSLPWSSADGMAERARGGVCSWVSGADSLVVLALALAGRCLIGVESGLSFALFFLALCLHRFRLAVSVIGVLKLSKPFS